MHAVIVTGVSRGLGEALAFALLGSGADVVGIGRTASAKLSGPRFRHVTCDFGLPSAIAATVAPALRALAETRPSAVTLINNAAVATPVGLIGRLDAAAIESAVAGSAAYCMSKAALEMLTRALVADHAGTSLECITLRPGIFETGMQQFMRSHDQAQFPSVGLFRGFKENGLLKDPADVAAAIVRKLVAAPVENGRTSTHVDLDG